jgi:hypothetical protein
MKYLVNSDILKISSAVTCGFQLTEIENNAPFLDLQLQRFILPMDTNY